MIHHLHFFKPLLFIFFIFLSSPLFAENQEQQANQDITQLYHHLKNQSIPDMSTRIERISRAFLGKPYLLGSLGEGAQGHYDQSPLYRTDAFDCETFVDTVLALAIATDQMQFKHMMNQIRYRNGLVSFTSRNHFTCLDWNRNNQRQGFVKDITTTIRDKNNKEVARFARALIDKPAWYQHMTDTQIHIQGLDAKQKQKRLHTLQQEGAQLPKSTSTIPYIPLSILFDRNGQANPYLFHQIPNAAIIEIVRPNWDLTPQIGTHLNISHLGFAFWKKDVLIFREASSTHGQVVDVSLIDYLRDTIKSPTIKGINIQIVLPK